MRVFYDHRQSTSLNQSMSPSAGKPQLVVEDWLQSDLPITIEPIRPVTAAELRRIHDPDYVHGVLNGTLSNGFGNRLPSVAETLRWTSGSLLCAAEYAVDELESVCSPTSGFHHAGYALGGGFCTFNGLALVVHNLAVRGQTVGIVDFDEHYGDGTQELLDRFEEEGLTGPVPHLTLGAINVREYARQGAFHEECVDAWLHELPGELTASFARCDLVLYQAGADSHINDPLGGTFTTVQYEHRDRIVFETFQDLGVPVVWNLAGGYQTPVEKVLKLHAITAETFLAVHET